MRRLVSTALALCFVSCLFAQADTTVKVKVTNYIPRTSNDHFLIQFGGTGWLNKPDSIHTTGFSRTFNMYLMLDFPFKTNPHFSVGIGPGIASDNIFLNKTYVGLKDNNSTIRFKDLSDTNYFKKYKLGTVYAEAPVELRYRSDKDNDAKSFKLALGVKVGYLLDAKVKGKTLVDKNGNTLLSYIDKEGNTKYFNSVRVSGMARIGYGHFSVFGSYSFTPLFKEGAGPQVKPLTIGLTISGL
ncbi:MAG: outer membrane beta-barrel protein [Flavisolibacter sp.]